MSSSLTTDPIKRAHILRVSAECGADPRTVQRYIERTIKKPVVALARAIEQAEAKVRQTHLQA